MPLSQTTELQNRYNKITEIFLEVLEKEEAERGNFLSTICDGDNDLRLEVEKLIKDSQEVKTFLSSPLVDLSSLVFNQLEQDFLEQDLIGVEIGKYKITKLIAQGGMGTVYEATRKELSESKPIAIKILPANANTKTLLARFHIECKAMANLEHPFIARLLDFGITPNNLPYIVMELVDGKSIDKYCQSKKLTVKEILQLFCKVCNSVQYAHSNLVVHRDLKPSNILVMPDGTPKLLDFGIAKILREEKSDAKTNLTQTGFIAMTPAYASPEQVLGKHITVSTDVYALAVLLYKLLTHTFPYEITSNSPREMEKVICEQPPLKPSLSVSSLEKTNTNINAKEVKKLAKELAGDLDNILLMALRKEPERRYKSVEQFSKDVECYLNGFPVLARKDTFRYRTEKFIKRNKLRLVTSVLVVALFLGGVFGILWQTNKAKQEREKAFLQSQLSIERARDIRDLTSNILFKYNKDLEKMPGATALREEMISEAIKYLDRLNQQSAKDLDVKYELASAYQRVGDIQGRPFSASAGNISNTVESYKKSLNLFEEIANLDPNNTKFQLELSFALERMGEILNGMGDVDLAMSYYEKSKIIRETIAKLKRNDRAIQQSLASCYSKIGDILRSKGNFLEMMEFYCKALKISTFLVKQEPNNEQFRRGLAVVHTRLIIVYQNMYDLIKYRKEDLITNNDLLKKSLFYNQLITENAKSALSKNPTNPILQNDLAGCYLENSLILFKIGNKEEARMLLEEAIKILDQLAENDPNNKQYNFLLATAYKQVAQIEEAKAKNDLAVNFYNKAKNIYQKLFENDSKNVVYQNELGDVYSSLGCFYMKLSSKDNVKKYLSKSFDCYKNLVSKNPTNINFQTKSLQVLILLTSFLVEKGEIETASNITKEVFKEYELARSTKISPVELASYSWLLLNCEPISLRNKELAIDYSREANKISEGKNFAVLLNFLSVAKNSHELNELQNTLKDLTDCSTIN